MEFDTTGLKLQKTIQDIDGHTFSVDWDSPKAACPVCGDVVYSTITRPRFFKSFDVMYGQTTTKRIALVTPNTLTRVNLIWKVTSFNTTNNAEVICIMWENPTFSSLGTLKPTYNNDRNGTDDAELIVYEDPSMTVNGTALSKRIVNGMQPQRQITPQDGRVLKQNTMYQITMNPNVAATDISFELNWAEVK